MTHISRRTIVLGAGAASLLAGCGTASEDSASSGEPKTLKISAIPDQDPEKLNRLYPALATLLEKAAGVPVEYVPLTEYPAVVRAFEIGDIQLAWTGGLTGVQARTRVKGATAVAQRDIDAEFHSVFIAGKAARVTPFTDVAGLKALAGRSLTFGSETSTSGRLMPQYFMRQAGVDLTDLAGPPGFSGSHDATIEAVASGSFQVGALNEQVWKEAAADPATVRDAQVVFRTPGYADYHWVLRPDVDAKVGSGVSRRVVDVLLALDPGRPEDAEVLDLFGAKRFIPTTESAYDDIAAIAQDLGLLT
jgi:phosphonate transport system substrate-binding protein